jgi:anaerobic magnesium-protoporphyrin IX monomethyl ester cyclase
VPNIAYRDGKRHVRTAIEIEDNALVETPIQYQRFKGRGLNEFVSLRTAKSCPFSCEFCAFPTRAGRYNYMAVDAVERELDRLREACGEATVSFLDDTFNVPKKRFRELLRMMIKKRYGFRWNSFYRSDHGDAETIELMKESGCQGVFLGTESGSNTILQAMNKSARREHYLDAIPRLREAGIITYASMIIGFPGETEETVAETVSLLETAAPDFFRAQLWYADPTTPVMEKKDRHGIEGSGFGWRHATMDATTAADIIEDMFRGVKHSTWLPQWGFELWSVFYLIRHGLTLERVKAFAAGFNAAVRTQLEAPSMRHLTDAEVVRLQEVVRERV